YIAMSSSAPAPFAGGATALTVSLWIYPSDTSHRQTLVSYDGNTTDGNGGGFRISVADPGQASNYICADDNTSSTTGKTPACINYPNQDGHYHLIAVTITNPTWTIYSVDPNASCSVSSSTGSYPTPSFTAGGTWRLGASGNNKQFGWVGWMDEVKIWKYPLSPTDLTNLCNYNTPSGNIYVTLTTGTATKTGTYTRTNSGTQTASGVTTQSGTQTASGVTTQTATQTASGVTTQSGTQTASGVTTQSGTQTASGVTTKSGTQTASGVTTQSGTQTASGVTTQSGT